MVTPNAEITGSPKASPAERSEAMLNEKLGRQTEPSREDALYECTNCGRNRITWNQKMVYRGVRDCCPDCYRGGIVHTTRRMPNATELTGAEGVRVE